MKKNPEISVIMPVYNKMIFLQSSVNSVLEQDFLDFELIIIDDGSTDNSLHLLLKMEKEDKRIKVFQQKNKGVSYARNQGIEFAQGKYVTFLDADDLYEKTFLKDMHTQLEKGFNVAYCGNSNKVKNIKKERKMNFSSEDILINYLLYKCSPNMNSWMIRKTFLEKNKIRFQTNLKLGEDITFLSTVLFYEKNVTYVKAYLTIYNLNVENSLSSNKLSLIDEDIKWLCVLNDFFQDNVKDVRSKKALSIINTYRMPAAIIYKLEKQKLAKSELKKNLEYYKPYLDKINFSNGLKSIKLNIYYYKLRLRAFK